MSVWAYSGGAGCTEENLTHLLVKLRGKDETIVSLQSENAMLRLKLAELRASVAITRAQKQNMRRQFLHAQSTLNRTRNELKDCRNTAQALRFDIDELRCCVENHPKVSSESLQQSCAGMMSRLESQILEKSNAVMASLNQQLAASKAEYRKLHDLYSLEKSRRKALHNTMIELRGNIRVHCRVRPMLTFDRRLVSDGMSVASGTARSSVGQLEEVVSLQDEETVCVQTLRQQLSGVGVATKHFDFDHVYGPSENQANVFAEVQPLLTSLLDGYNVCLMAYGQTGSGKTHSMLGGGLESGVSSSDIWWHSADSSPGKYPPQCSDHGIIPRAAVEIFRLIEDRSADCQVSLDVSVVEIYNNEIFDLLKESSSKCDITFKDDGSIDLLGVTCRDAANSQDIMKYVLLGLQRRAESATGVHQHSSRSHLIITLNLHTTLLDKDISPTTGLDNLPPTNTTRVNRSLSFDSDAALRTHSDARPPSPRRSPSPSGRSRTPLRVSSFSSASPSSTPRRPMSTPLRSHATPGQAQGVGRQSHAGVVSTKLQLVDLAGSECAALSGVVGTGMREASFINRSLSSLADVLAALAKKQQHVPYRNSKLTHVLQDTIGGDAKMLVLTCVAPAQRYITESVQCLQFGSRIRQVQRGPTQRAKLPSVPHSSRGDSPHTPRERH